MDVSAVAGDPSASSAAKVRRRVLPVLIAAWFVAYLDRFNVSFAALQMNEQLGLSAAAFGFGAGIFFVGYSLFEIPSNLIMTRVGPRRWLSRIMITWGLCSVAMMWTRSPGSFYVLRFLLGVAEAGCFPGMAFYLGQWLAPRERAAALGLLGSVAMISGVVGAPMAAGLLALNGTLGLAGWQWLFLVEGIPAVVLGVCVLAWLPDTPEAVNWLTPGERSWLAAHMSRERVLQPTRASLAAIASDRRYWIWAATFFCFSAAGGALRLFQPIILRQVAGLNNTLAATLSAIPALAGTVAIIYVGRRSTHVDERRWHTALPMWVAAVGLGLVGVTYGLTGALLVAAVANVGVGAQPPLIASVSAAATGSANAVGIAFVNAIGAMGSFVGPYFVGYLFDKTGGLAIACAIAGGVMALAGILSLTVGDAVAFRTPVPSQVTAV